MHVPTMTAHVAPLATKAADTNLLNRIRGEFHEMPGMRLTSEQAIRLWALDRRTCEAVLDRLVTVGFLVCDDRGHYRKAHGGY